MDNILEALVELFEIKAGKPQLLDSAGVPIQTTMRLLEHAAASPGNDIQLQLSVSFEAEDHDNFPDLACARKSNGKKNKRSSGR